MFIYGRGDDDDSWQYAGWFSNLELFSKTWEATDIRTVSTMSSEHTHQKIQPDHETTRLPFVVTFFFLANPQTGQHPVGVAPSLLALIVLLRVLCWGQIVNVKYVWVLRFEIWGASDLICSSEIIILTPHSWELLRQILGYDKLWIRSRPQNRWGLQIRPKIF